MATNGDGVKNLWAITGLGIGALFTLVTTISMFILNDIKTEMKSTSVKLQDICITVAKHDLLLKYPYSTRKQILSGGSEVGGDSGN